MTIWWRETLVLMGSAVAFAAFFGLFLPLLSGWLDDSIVLGLPLGTVMAGGGSILVLIALAFWYCSRQDRLDEAFGVSDEEE